MMMSSEKERPTTTEKDIPILHLEDDEKDAELIQAILDSAGISCQITRVQSASEFSAALSEERYELILGDYHLPAYDGMSALYFSRENYPDIPFIFVSGTLGEDAAIEGLTQGATDYVLKNKLTRLEPAVKRALIEAENQRKRKDAEEALRLSEAKYRTLTEASNDIVFIIDSTLRVAFVNSIATKYLEKEREEIIGLPLVDLFPAAIAESYNKFLGELFESATPIYWEAPSWFPRGEIWLGTWLVPLKDDTEIVTQVMGVARDITERKRSEEALRESEELHRITIENILDPVFITADDGQFTFICLNVPHTLGYTIEEVQAMGNISHLVGKGIFNFKELEESGEIHNIERVIADKSGRERIFLITVKRVSIKGGTILYTCHDITELKQAEEALWESSQMLKLVLDNMPVYVFWKDRNSVYLGCNNLFAAKAGFNSPEEIIGSSDLDTVWKLEEAERYRADDRMVMETGVPKLNYEEKQYPPDGSVDWVRTSKVPLRNPKGDVIGVLGTFEDITERKQHEHEREVIITVSAALRQATTRTEIINLILDQLVDLFDADGTVLVLPDAQAGGLIVEMGSGAVGEKMIGLNIPPEKGVSNWVITNKNPYLHNRADQDPLFYLPDLLGDSHCLISVPLIAQEQAIGALGIVRQTDFVEQNLRLLTAIGDIAANAIQRVTLHEQTERQLHRLIALHQIDLAISTNNDLNITLNVILGNVKDELEVDAVSILLLNPVTHTLNYAAGIGFRTHNIEQSRVKLGNGCAGRAAQEQRTVSCLDIEQGGGNLIRSSLLAGEDFISHYVTPLVVKGQIKGVLEFFHRKTLKPEHTWLSYFETLATQAAIAIENASLFENLQRSNMELTLAYDATIEGWSRALDLRDKETEGHTQRVTEMTLALAEKMGMSTAEKSDLRRGALLHDIGKLGVPDEILHKPEPLSDDEWEIMRQHPLLAYQMLAPIAYLKHALEIPYCHHEKWDGSGYPRGLRGNEIPLAARVFAVVDVFDALISDRPYRPAWSKGKAYNYIREQSGQDFDPEVVKAFLQTE